VLLPRKPTLFRLSTGILQRVEIYNLTKTHQFAVRTHPILQVKDGVMMKNRSKTSFPFGSAMSKKSVPSITRAFVTAQARRVALTRK
jgi:hypothetical protein